MVKKNIRIKDIAREANVSTGTVDRVIHGRGNVASKKRARILAVMKQLGYERNIVASTLAYNRSFRIAVLLPDPQSDPYWREPLQGVESAIHTVQHFGISMKPYFFNLFDPKEFLHKGMDALSSKPDALLLAPLFLKEAKLLLEKAHHLNIPNVMINTNLYNESTLSYIGPDSYQSGLLAGRLLNFRCREEGVVLLLNLSKGNTTAHHLIEKEEGFRDYFRMQNCSTTKIIKYNFEQFDQRDKLRIFLDNLLHLHPDIEGIFITNSRSHLVIEALPSAVSTRLFIVGYDLLEQNVQHLLDNKINFLLNQNSFEQGYLGITTLYNHFILNKEIEPNQFLPLDIIVKENYMYHSRNIPSPPPFIPGIS